MRILSKADVQQVMDMDACLQANEEAFIAVAAGRAIVPVRHHIPVEGQRDAVSLFMPGYLPDAPALGLKVVSVFPTNAAAGRGTTLGAIMLLDPATGAPAALMDGTWLTSLRTGAGTGVATKYLARPDSRVLTLLGAGGMGFHQVEAVLAVRRIEQVLIWNRTPARAEALAARVREFCAAAGRRVAVQATADQEGAVRAADVVVAGTSAAEPVVHGSWVRPGTHVNLIGAHGAGMREGDDELLRRSAVRAVDALESAAAAGELRLPIEAGVVRREDFTAIGRIIAAEAPGRQNPAQITWFKSVGLAAQDMACAAAVLRRAAELNLGLEYDLEAAPDPD
jgi:ornithine cyclodeaminase